MTWLGTLYKCTIGFQLDLYIEDTLFSCVCVGFHLVLDLHLISSVFGFSVNVTLFYALLAATHFKLSTMPVLCLLLRISSFGFWKHCYRLCFGHLFCCHNRLPCNHLLNAEFLIFKYLIVYPRFTFNLLT